MFYFIFLVVDLVLMATLAMCEWNS